MTIRYIINKNQICGDFGSQRKQEEVGKLKDNAREEKEQDDWLQKEKQEEQDEEQD